MGGEGAGGQQQSGPGAFETFASLALPLAAGVAGFVRPEAGQGLAHVANLLTAQRRLGFDTEDRARQEREREEEARLFPQLVSAAQSGNLDTLNIASTPEKFRAPMLTMIGEQRRATRELDQQRAGVAERNRFFGAVARGRQDPMSVPGLLAELEAAAPTTPMGSEALQFAITQLTPIAERVGFMRPTAEKYAPSRTLTPDEVGAQDLFGTSAGPPPPPDVSIREVTPRVEAEIGRRAFLPLPSPGTPAFRELEQSLGAPERPQDLAERLKAERVVAGLQAAPPTAQDLAAQAEAITRTLPSGFRAFPVVRVDELGQQSTTFTVREVPATLTADQVARLQQLDQAFFAGQLPADQYRAGVLALGVDPATARLLVGQGLEERGRTEARARSEDQFNRLMANDGFSQAARVVGMTGQQVAARRALLDNPIAFSQLDPKRQAQIVGDFLDLADRHARMLGAFMQSNAPDNLKRAFSGGTAPPPAPTGGGFTPGAGPAPTPQTQQYLQGTR